MAFAQRGKPRFPIINCDLGDVRGTPGLPPPTRMAKDLSQGGRKWSSVGGPAAMFLATTSTTANAVGAFGAMVSPGTSDERTQRTFTSSVCSQETRQQLVRGRPVIGARYRVVTSDHGQAILGRPVGDLELRDPGPPPRRRAADVEVAFRDHLQVADDVHIDTEQVVFPLDGGAVWAYRARVTGGTDHTDVRAYVRARDLELLYAQDVHCAAVYGEGSVFSVNPGRSQQPEGVRLLGLGPTADALTTTLTTVTTAKGTATRDRQRDFRYLPTDAGFDEVAAFHHVAAAARFFRELLGDDVFTEAPFAPLEVRVLDRSVRAQVGAFFPGLNLIALSDGSRPASRSGDICIHEFTHGVVHRVARLSDENATAIARGVNEGFADYAQATIYNDPRFGDWVRDDAKGARNCGDPTLRLPPVPDDRTDRYVVGAAWAALLWDLRSSLGAGVADAIAFHALQFLVPSTDYDGCRHALHQADLALFPARTRGRHHDEIDRLLDARLA